MMTPYNEIFLDHLNCEVADCWATAEQKTRESVKDKYHNPNEENITFLFKSELRATVADASDRNRFASALQKDLESILQISYIDSYGLATGLIARVNFHDRAHEGRASGSDFGLVISRPQISHDWHMNAITIKRDSRSALLAQAKLGRHQSPKNNKLKWGRLTKTQERVVPHQLSYFSLVLYRLTDPEASQLESFQWQLCRDANLPDIKNWLASGEFPISMSSKDVILKLAAGTIGTTESAIIDQIVDPCSRKCEVIEIQVFWEDPNWPPAILAQEHFTSKKQKFVQLLRR